jgi:hypothetical protein
MPIYDFDFNQQFSTIDKLPDHRNDSEKLNSSLSVYNHDNPDIAYAERLSEEIINVSGAWVMIFKRRRNEGDEVWDEDADPTYKRGKRMKGYFVPEPAEISVTRWGVDVENQTTIVFSRAVILREFGNLMVGEGDLIVVPHNSLIGTQFTDMRSGTNNRMDTYRVIKSGDTINFKYRWIYWSCLCQNIIDDKTIDVDFRKEENLINV